MEKWSARAKGQSLENTTPDEYLATLDEYTAAKSQLVSDLNSLTVPALSKLVGVKEDVISSAGREITVNGWLSRNIEPWLTPSRSELPDTERRHFARAVSLEQKRAALIEWKKGIEEEVEDDTPMPMADVDGVKSQLAKLENSDKITAKERRLYAKVLGVSQKRKGEKAADTDQRLRNTYSLYNSLKGKNPGHLEDEGPDREELIRMAKLAGLMGQNVKGTSKSLYWLRNELIKWANSISQRTFSGDQAVSALTAIRDMAKAKEPIRVSHLKRLGEMAPMYKDVDVYTQGDQILAKVLNHQEVLPPEGGRPDNELYERFDRFMDDPVKFFTPIAKEIANVIDGMLDRMREAGNTSMWPTIFQDEVKALFVAGGFPDDVAEKLAQTRAFFSVVMFDELEELLEIAGGSASDNRIINPIQIATDLASSLSRSGWDVDQNGNELSITSQTRRGKKGQCFGDIIVDNTGLIQAKGIYDGAGYIESFSSSNPDEIVSRLSDLVITGSLPAEVTLRVGDMDINGQTVTIHEVDHDTQRVTGYNGEILKFDKFEERHGVQIKRRPKLTDDGSLEYLNARMAQLEEDIDLKKQYSHENIRAELRELGKRKAEAEGVNDIEITDELVDLYRNSNYIEDIVKWSKEQGYDGNFGYHLYARVEEEALKRRQAENDARPEVKIGKRIFAHLQTHYKARPGEAGRSVVIRTGAGKVYVQQPEMSEDGTRFILKATYHGDNTHDMTFDYKDSQFEKDYPVVDGLIMDSAKSVLDQVGTDIRDFVSRFKTATDTSDLPEFGENLDKAKGLERKDIAALIRKQVKDDTESGKLPSGLKVSVRTEPGRSKSINLTVTNLPESIPLWNPDYLADPDGDVFRGGTNSYHREATALLSRLEAIGNQYNDSWGDPYADYGKEKNYYYFAKIDHNIQSERRESEKHSNNPTEDEIYDVTSRIMAYALSPEDDKSKVLLRSVVQGDGDTYEPALEEYLKVLPSRSLGHKRNRQGIALRKIWHDHGSVEDLRKLLIDHRNSERKQPEAKPKTEQEEFQGEEFDVILHDRMLVNYQAKNPVPLDEGESLLKSEIISEKTKVSKRDQQAFDLPETIDAWRLSVIETEEGTKSGSLEYMADGGSAGGTKRYAEFKRLEHDAISRVADKQHKKLIAMMESNESDLLSESDTKPDSNSVKAEVDSSNNPESILNQIIAGETGDFMESANALTQLGEELEANGTAEQYSDLIDQAVAKIMELEAAEGAV